jgi:hypothetical protein
MESSANWTEIGIFVVTVLGLIGALERRLSGKLDKAKYDDNEKARRREVEEARKEIEEAREKERERIDTLREAERIRVDDTFKSFFERMDRHQNESLRFREEIRDSISKIQVDFARLTNRNKS